MSKRISIRVAGESGQGINSIGEALGQSFKEVGLFTFSYREYPSLIRGGNAFQQIEVSSQPVNAPTRGCDLLMCQSRVAFHTYYHQVNHGGFIIHDIARMDLKPEEQEWFKERDIDLVYLDAAKIAIASGGKRLMSNTVLVGAIWKLLQLPITATEAVIRQIFADKPQYIDINLACLRAGYAEELPRPDNVSLSPGTDPQVHESVLVTGNHALALGAVAAGARALFAYPMTPSSSILSYLAEVQHQTGMLVKQADDEIAAAQMALGSMFMGTRAFTATSGGGFDLMTETVSLSGMTETPFVCVLAQRPGPATGLPTWTSAADLMLAIYSGHGEFPRIVMAVNDAESAYVMMQEAFNLAEEYQVPVIIMTDKQIAESWFQVKRFPENRVLRRGLPVDEAALDALKPHDRYALTESGVSARWLPGQADATFVANSDEHLEDGSLTEDAEPARAMYDKRLRKLDTIAKILPQPTLYGPTDADITFIGWGSTKPIMLDAFATLAEQRGTQAQSQVPTVNYLHFSYLWPLKTEAFVELTARAKRIVLIENNATGQLGLILKQATGYDFKETFLKYDGRPFFVNELVDYITKPSGQA